MGNQFEGAMACRYPVLALSLPLSPASCLAGPIFLTVARFASFAATAGRLRPVVFAPGPSMRRSSLRAADRPPPA
jgi:hypothetical protein